ncbi:MAG: PH domain-containing protein [Clostridium sp.]|nr:PH domain-containing protein [Clostridium sp.]MCM1443897.1 PH domain-containing protein [Candidatus Amulumruptor caecigallinarius]
MQETIYKQAKEFKHKYPRTIAWRLNAHSKVLANHICKDEAIQYVFTAQKNDNPLDIISTNIIVITDKRILLGQKRLLFGYLFSSITPDMFNDIKVKMGVIWGKILIDTVKEFIVLSNIQMEALQEIEKVVSKYIMEQKSKYIEVEKNV